MDIIALVLFVWLLFARFITKRSILIGSVIVARCQTEWAPSLTDSKNPAGQRMRDIISRKIVPRYGEWVAESRGFLNTLFITGVLTVSVGLLTYFNMTNNGAVYPYMLLIAMMCIAHALTAIGYYITFQRTAKMLTAHNLVLNLVQALNILQSTEELPEEAYDSVDTITAVTTDKQMWEQLTTDIVQTEEE